MAESIGSNAGSGGLADVQENMGAGDVQVAQAVEQGAESGEALESGNAAQAASSEAGLNPVPVFRPAPGESQTISAEAGQRYIINFDPAAAQVSLEDDQLVLNFNDGGQIFFSDLGNLGDGPDSVFEMAGVDVPMAGLINQAAGPVDQGAPEAQSLETAAGAEDVVLSQGGSTGPGGPTDVISLLQGQGVLDPTALSFRLIELPEGGVAPVSDDGNLIVGITVDVPPGDGPPSDNPTFISGQFDGGFEDSAPNQHLGDKSQIFMQLTVDFDPAGGEELQSITIGDIPEGAQVFVGSPAELVALTDGSLTVSANDFDKIFISPPPDSDGDLALTIVGQVSQGFAEFDLPAVLVTAVVDAVADQPVLATSIDSESETPELTISAQFGDLDGSESHSIEITGVPRDWILEESAFGDDNAVLVDGDPGSNFVTYVITVAGGSFDGTLSFDPNGWTSTTLADGSPNLDGAAEIIVVAKAAETPTDEGELTTLNNVSTVNATETFGGGTTRGGPDDDPPDVAAPEVTVTVGGDGTFKEDQSNSVRISAQTGAASDELTEVELTGLGDGWTLGANDLADILALDGVQSATFVGGTLTITFAEDVSDFAFDVNLTPPSDEDLDLSGVTLSATARDGADSNQTATATVTADDLVVDAVLDQFADVENSGTVVVHESHQVQFVNLGLSLSLEDTGNPGQAPGPDEDGSESQGVTLTLSDPLPHGAEILTSQGSGTVTGGPLVFTVTGDNLADAVAGLQVKVPAGFDGWIKGTLSTVSAEANTPDAVPGSATGGDLETDTTDNVMTDQTTFMVDVVDTDVSPPEVFVNKKYLCIHEDEQEYFRIDISADDGDVISQVSIQNLPSGVDGWSVWVGDGVLDGSFNFATGIYTPPPGLDELSLRVFLTPPPDSDRDVATDVGADIQITATASDGANSAESDPVTVDVDVDAVAGQILACDIWVYDDASDGDKGFSIHEQGSVRVKASFTEFQDASEVHSITIDIPEGFHVDPASLTNQGGVTATIVGGQVLLSVPTGTHGVEHVDYRFDVSANPGAKSGIFKATFATEETLTDVDCCIQNNAYSGSLSKHVDVIESASQVSAQQLSTKIQADTGGSEQLVRYTFENNGNVFSALVLLDENGQQDPTVVNLPFQIDYSIDSKVSLEHVATLAGDLGQENSLEAALITALEVGEPGQEVAVADMGTGLRVGSPSAGQDNLVEREAVDLNDPADNGDSYSTAISEPWATRDVSQSDNATGTGGDALSRLVWNGGSAEGGSGIDVLEVSRDLDLTDVADGAIGHVEVLKLDESKAITLTLNEDDVLETTDTVSSPLHVLGSGNDTVKLESSAGSWSASDSGQNNPSYFGWVEYTHSSGAKVLIDPDVAVQIA
ncbi:MAG: hypothetical protein AAF530_07875 [Pseudomonadota bacterium]